MRRSFTFLICATCVALVTTTGATNALAGETPNYAGRYSLQDKKGTPGSNTTLEVAQRENSVEVTRNEQGKKVTNRYPLDGSEGEYISPGGLRGTCRAQWKGKQLIIESLVETRVQGAPHPVHEHTKERWQLSADSKTLTIQTDVDFPDFPADISAAVAATTSGKEKFVRIEDH